MKIAGILPGRIAEKATLRVRSLHPYSAELTSDQIGIIADIAEKYGSGTVHVTPRQTIEIPDIERSYIDEIRIHLEKNGLYIGSSDKRLRNVIACSRWCLYNAHPVSDLALQLNRQYQERQLPGKMTISLSGCDFSCVRSRTSDIGVIARSDIELTDKKCRQCSLCIKEPLGCQVDAITVTEEGVTIDTERCIRCGFCTNVCKPETIRLAFRSFDVFIGGGGGLRPREAVRYKNIPSEGDLLKEIERIVTIYSDTAEEGERITDVIDRVGIEVFKAESA